MRMLTRKSVCIVLQLLTMVGVLVGMLVGCYLLWEMTDLYMLNGRIYTFPIEEQAAIWQEAVYDFVDDTIVYGLVAVGVLVLSLISGIAAAIMTVFIKTEKP